MQNLYIFFASNAKINPNHLILYILHYNAKFYIFLIKNYSFDCKICYNTRKFQFIILIDLKVLYGLQKGIL